MVNNEVWANETRENSIYFDGLRSNTVYELKVFIRTQKDFNVRRFLLVGFTTKHEGKSTADTVDHSTPVQMFTRV